MLYKGIFITGTDTGVGKTVVTGGIALALRKRGIDVGIMKAIQTGCYQKGNKIIPPDSEFLISLTGTEDPIDLVTPYRFTHPLAPLAASRLERQDIDIEKILDAYLELSKRHDMVIVEGTGGILVPVTRELFVLDIIKRLDIPVIVVARSGIGTINHTLLTVRYAIHCGITISGIIINQAADKQISEGEKQNPKIIMELSGIPVIGVIPYMSSLSRSLIEETFLKNIGDYIIRLTL